MTMLDSGEATITGGDQWTTPVLLPFGYFEYYVTGSYTASSTLQVSFDGGSTWLDRFDDLEGNGVASGLEYLAAPAQVRLGVKTGAYTSGTLTARVLKWRVD